MTTAVLTSEALTGDLSAKTPNLASEVAAGVPLVSWAIAAALGEAVLSEHTVDVTRWFNDNLRAKVRARRLDLMTKQDRFDITCAVQRAVDYVVATHQARAQVTIGGVPVAPASVYFPAGVYPLAGLRVDGRVRLVGAGISTTDVCFAGFTAAEVAGKLAGTSVPAVKLGDVEVVLVITGGAAGDSASMDGPTAPGCLEGMGVSGAAYFSKADAVLSDTPNSVLPLARHVLLVEERPLPGYRLQDLYVIGSRSDAIRFAAGMTECHADRVRVDSAGGYCVRVSGSASVGSRPVALAWTRFTVATNRPGIPPSYDADKKVFDGYGDFLEVDKVAAANFPAAPPLASLPTWYAHGPTRETAPGVVGLADEPEVKVADYWLWCQGIFGLESKDGSLFCAVADARIEVNSILIPPTVVSDPDPKKAMYAPGALIHVNRPGMLTTIGMNTIRGKFSVADAVVLVQIQAELTRVMLHDVSLGSSEIASVHFLPSATPAVPGLTAAIADGEVQGGVATWVDTANEPHWSRLQLGSRSVSSVRNQGPRSPTTFLNALNLPGDRWHRAGDIVFDARTALVAGYSRLAYRLVSGPVSADGFVAFASVGLATTVVAQAFGLLLLDVSSGTLNLGAGLLVRLTGTTTSGAKVDTLVTVMDVDGRSRRTTVQGVTSVFAVGATVALSNPTTFQWTDVLVAVEGT